MNLSKLLNMSSPELAYRSRQEVSKWVDWTARPPKGGLLYSASIGADTVAVERFRGTLPGRFFRGVETSDSADTLRQELPAASHAIFAAVDRLRSRRFNLLGYQDLSFGDPIDWHRDPISGRRSPDLHWSQIDALDGDQVGDSKVVWELNRHQWLVPLGQAYWLTSDERHAQEALRLVDEWSVANPYGHGINWSSSLEVAYRVIAWIWTFVLQRDSAALSGVAAAGVCGLIRQHAIHIARYLSRYFSPNTHLTGEALALFYVGTLFPAFPESPRWRRLGFKVLVEQCARQIHSDGVYFEQATCYQRYTLEIYLHFLLLADRNGIAVPPFVRQRVVHMCDFVRAVSGADGLMPHVGDTDGGCLLPLASRGPVDGRGALAIAAVMFERPDYAVTVGAAPPEVLWLLGTEAWRRFQQLHDSENDATARRSQSFEHGGYIVMAGNISEQHQLIFDVGPLGCPISGAHGHADLLSVQCSAFGEPYLVDPGTFCYAGQSAWRNHFRSTAAHSTLTVDRLAQAKPTAPFRWSARPAATLRAWTSTPTYDYADASHCSYASLPDPVVHRRRIIFVKTRGWVVIDDIEGKAEHLIEVRFQFAAMPVRLGPGLAAAASGRGGAGLWIVPFSSAPLQSRIAEGQEDPPEGWISSNYGRREPAPLVAYSTTQCLPVRIVTLLMPVRRLCDHPPRVEVLFDETGRLTGLAFPDDGGIVRFDDSGGVALTEGKP